MFVRRMVFARKLVRQLTEEHLAEHPHATSPEVFAAVSADIEAAGLDIDRDELIRWIEFVMRIIELFRGKDD